MIEKNKFDPYHFRGQLLTPSLMDEAKYMLKIKITLKSIQKCFLCVKKIHFKILILRMMTFQMLLLVVMVSQMLSKYMPITTTCLLTYVPFFVVIAASSGASRHEI
jgi:hypothetical protein